MPQDNTRSSAARTSTAEVDTSRGARYGKQLAAHLGRRLRTGWDDASGTGQVWFDGGSCEMHAEPERLVLQARADSAFADGPELGRLELVEDVVASHLVRFGTRDELAVTWQRSDGTSSRTYRHTDESPEGHRMPSPADG